MSDETKIVLKEIYQVFAKDMANIAETTIGEVIAKYLPYCETDYCANVEQRTREWLENFFNGKEDEFIKNPVLREFSCQEARELIFQQHKTELVELINKDLLDENNRLKSLYERSRY